jgi:uncharacterized protein YciI
LQLIAAGHGGTSSRRLGSASALKTSSSREQTAIWLLMIGSLLAAYQTVACRTVLVGGRRLCGVPTFVLRLIAPRPNFAQTMTDTEREIMGRHAAHWAPYLERGDMVVFGPVLTDEDSYGLAVVDADDERALRDFAAEDPVVTTGTAAFELGRMAAGHVRAR